jgi:hypothetical protein
MAVCRKSGQLRREPSQMSPVVDSPSPSSTSAGQPLRRSERVRTVVESAARPFTLPPIEDSVVASALTIISVLEFIGAPIAGLEVGSDDKFDGWVVFISGIISGLILLGFARVIQHTFESSQRLKRLEMLMERSYDDK